MRRVLLTYRYLVFSAFVVCNAIIASVGVWNLGLAQTDGQQLPVDTFLIFLGAFGLAFILPLIFAEIVWRNVVTSHVWFECLWVGLFWVMELAGASALSAIAPGIMCNPGSGVVAFIDASDACTSTRVLLAFTWICTIILMFYLLLLVLAAFTHQRGHKGQPRVWHTPVRSFAWGDGRQCLRSAPPSPSLPYFRASTMATTTRKASAPIVAPQPRRVPAPLIYNAHRNGLGSEYEIEHYPPPSEKPVPPVPAAPPPHRVLQNTREAVAEPSVSLYPEHLRPMLLSTPARQSVQAQPFPPTPPPLGDWPRKDALTQPARRKEQRIPPPAFVFPSSGPRASTESVSAAPPPVRPRQPSGPRTRSRSGSGEGHRPPPLDLSRISAFRGDAARN